MTMKSGKCNDNNGNKKRQEVNFYTFNYYNINIFFVSVFEYVYKKNNVQKRIEYFMAILYCKVYGKVCKRLLV